MSNPLLAYYPLNSRMTTIFDKIALEQLNSVIVSERPVVHANAPEVNYVVATFSHEMKAIGYIVSKELYIHLHNDPNGSNRSEAILKLAKQYKGIWGGKVMYPNFPKQVMEAGEGELLFNALIHYWSFGEWLPAYSNVHGKEYVKEPRSELKEETETTVLEIVTMDDMKQYFFKLLGSKSSLPSSLIEYVNECIKLGWTKQYNGEIPFRETACRVAYSLAQEGEPIDEIVKTTTDVLRVIALLSSSDVELKTPVKVKSMKRRTRRVVISALEKVISESDVKQYAGLWKVAFHSLHVGEYGGRVAVIASKYRSMRSVPTEETAIAEALKISNVLAATELLKKKPPVMARTLDKLLRDSSDKDANIVLETFKEAAAKVESKVLIQLLGHFKGRDLNTVSERVVFLPGKNGKALIAPSLKKLDWKLCDSVKQIIRSALKENFAKRNLLVGRKVFIHADVNNILLPLQLASITENKKSVARGSRVPLDLIESDKDKNVVRLFLQWIGRDIDLSGLFLSEDFTRTTTVAYTHLREKFATHSGDITNAPAPNGASEFIDIDMDLALRSGYRYVLIDIRVFAGPTFLHHEECFAGFMLRQEPQSGEIYEPKTVKAKFDITSESQAVSPCVIDMKTREMIWVDTALKIDGPVNNLVRNHATSVQMVKGFLKMTDTKLTLPELVQLHMESGESTKVFEEEDADFVVGSGNYDLDAYDFTTINSKWV
jgi:hypothetical protein